MIACAILGAGVVGNEWGLFAPQQNRSPSSSGLNRAIFTTAFAALALLGSKFVLIGMTVGFAIATIHIITDEGTRSLRQGSLSDRIEHVMCNMVWYGLCFGVCGPLLTA